MVDEFRTPRGTVWVRRGGEDDEMAQDDPKSWPHASQDGLYTLPGLKTKFRVRKGDSYPPNGQLVEAVVKLTPQQKAAATRARKAAEKGGAESTDSAGGGSESS